MASEEEVKQEKTARVTEQEMADVRKEPKPGGKKRIVYDAGRQKDGGSIKQTAEDLGGTTTSNVRQHIVQCYTVHGFGYRIQGDKFWVLGDPTLTWEQQQAAKEKKSEDTPKETETKAEGKGKGGEKKTSKKEPEPTTATADDDLDL